MSAPMGVAPVARGRNRWIALMPGSRSYKVQISTTFGFDTLIVEEIVHDSTSLKVRGLPDSTTYYWRVGLIDSTGMTSFSMIWSFSTGIGGFVPPMLISPYNASEGVSTSPMLSWSPVPDAVSYLVQISKSFDFDTPVVEAKVYDTTAFRVRGLADSTMYYWRVAAIDSGSMGPYSMTWSFTTGIGRYQAPMLFWPMDMSSGIPTRPTLRWSRVPDAMAYNVQISKWPGLDSLVVDQKVQDSTSFHLATRDARAEML